MRHGRRLHLLQRRGRDTIGWDDDLGEPECARFFEPFFAPRMKSANELVAQFIRGVINDPDKHSLRREFFHRRMR